MNGSSILGATVSRVYGQTQGVPVIGSVEASMSGNIILRVGKVAVGEGWFQTEHIVLSPAEARTLIQRIEKHL